MRFSFYEIFYDRTRKWLPFNTGDCLIEVTAWAGLTVYIFFIFQYIHLARTLKYYSYIQFKPCITDYPQANSRVLICTGAREMNFRIQTAAVSVC
jgi:hypothetical protein